MVSKLKPTFITDEFVKATIDSITTGNQIILTTSVGSSTIYSDAQLQSINYSQSQSASKNITTPLNSAVVKLDTNTIVLELDLTNEKLNSDFQIATILINGRYKDNSILVGVVRFEHSELFPKFDETTGSIYEIKSRVYLSFSEISNATIIVSNAGMATASSVQDLRTYVDGAFNYDIARKSNDNIFMANNTFNKTLKAPNGVEGNASSASKLINPVNIAGEQFDGTKGIDLPGVNKKGSQDTSGNAGTATKLQTVRKLNGVSFDGTFDITVPSNNNNETIDGNKKFLQPIVGSITGNADTANTLVLNDIADGTDLNSLRIAGNYSCGTNKVGNAPVNNWFSLVVVQNGSVNGVQTLTDTNNGEVYTRTWNNSGSWFSPWGKLSSDSKVVHTGGDETINGKKTFNGVATFNNGIVNRPISMNGIKMDVSELVSGSYNVWGNDISGCPGDFGVVEVFENVKNTMYRFTQTNYQDGPHVWVQIRNSFGFSGWKRTL